MWTRLKYPPKKGTPGVERTMRYFVFYPPTNTVKLIDVSENEQAETILELVKREFGLKEDENGPSSTTIVLNYNGCDIKPKWTFADLNVPSGSIIRCIIKQQTAADLYIHCGFNKQLFKLFDSTITIETTIGTVRKKLSEKLGLPLSTFCLESCDGKQRFFDEIKLMTYDIKIHDHIYLKVWQGFEKFINSCVKGFTEHYSHDDLVRHYQLQVALHIAAFYGHTDLARYALEHGARSDRPVSEHPSRQWSCETSVSVLPDMLKCPIHIAVERGHIKMVDLFVRQSVLCTQTLDPITNYLPFQLAYSYLLEAKTKEERQRFNEIYFYLKDKQFNLKIPLNANAEYVASLLKVTSNKSKSHIVSAFFVRISLPMYCKIISWYERAREKAWKKYGGRFCTTSNVKRVFPETGLLGYKVLIDGYNNKFEVPSEQLRGPHQNDTISVDHGDLYAGFTNEERDKIIQMKAHIKQFALDERRRAKQGTPAHYSQAHRTQKLPQKLNNTNNQPAKKILATAAKTAAAMQAFEATSYASDLSSSQVLSSTSVSDFKPMKPIAEMENSAAHHYASTEIPSSTRLDNNHESKDKIKHTVNTNHQSTPHITTVEDDNKYKFPIIVSTIARSILKFKSKAANSSTKQTPQAMLSSFNAYLASSNRSGLEIELDKSAKPNGLFGKVQQTPKKAVVPKPKNPLSNSLPADRNQMLDLDSHVPLPDHPLCSSSPIKSRIDHEIHETTFQSYQRYASATTRTTAIDCLQEAAHFKRKPWLKKVEISKEMIRHKVQQRIRRAADEANKKPQLSPLRPTAGQSSHQSDIVPVN